MQKSSAPFTCLSLSLESQASTMFEFISKLTQIYLPSLLDKPDRLTIVPDCQIVKSDKKNK